MTELIWWMILLQAVLGLLDVVLHHNLIQHLAFQPGAGRELRLHGARSICYALVYVLLACSIPTGAWTWLVAVVLLVALGIKFKDWFDEGRFRRLPPAKYVLHGLLAINFGVLTTLLAPVLRDWSNQPTDLVLVSYSHWMLLLLLAGVAVGIFGLKDLTAARRLQRMAAKLDPGSRDLVQTAAEIGRVRSILVTGATGLIGRRLVPAWLAAGHSVTVLTRRPAVAAELGTPLNIVTSLEQLSAAHRIDAVVHLAGEPVAGGLWTRARKKYLLETRTALPQAIGAWLARTQHRPDVWLSASAIGFYGISEKPDETFVETAAAGEGFAAALCNRIETTSAEQAGTTRLVSLRIGLVLAIEGGYLAQLLPAIDLFAGVILGRGRQWQSWIHRDDAVRAIDRCLTDSNLRGPVNIVAPEPVCAKFLMKALGKKLARPVFLHVPEFVLRAVAGELAEELLLGSQRVSPQRLLQEGFQFRYPRLSDALDALL